MPFETVTFLQFEYQINLVFSENPNIVPLNIRTIKITEYAVIQARTSSGLNNGVVKIYNLMVPIFEWT